MNRKILYFVFISMAMILSACGANPSSSAINTQTVEHLLPVTGEGTNTPMGGYAPTTASGSNAPTGPALVDISQNANLGPILVDSKGMTLYLYTKDTQNSGSSTCVGNCASVWPPLLTLGKPTSGANVQASMLGTITRQDGTTQVTYNGWPLYYFKNDNAAGDANGEGVQGVWFVVTPDGTKK